MTDQGYRLGLVYPDDMWVDQDIHVVLDEWRQFLLPEVETITARTYVPMRDQHADLAIWLAENGEIEAAAKRTMRYRPDIVAYYCTTVSFIRGVAGDRDIVRRMADATGLPSVTTSSAVVDALHSLGIRRVATASPYMDDVNEALSGYLAECDIEVVSSRPLNLVEDHGLVPPERIRAAAESADDPRAEAIVISCTGQKISGFVSEMERQLGKPVIGSNQATGWQVLRRLGLEPRIPKRGVLFGDPFPSREPLAVT